MITEGTTDKVPAGSTGATGDASGASKASVDSGARPVERPRSASDALAKAAAAPPSGANTDATAEAAKAKGATDAGTRQPGATGDKAADKGPIPFDRHQTALNNLRTELETKFSQQLERVKWAGDYDSEQVQYVFNLFKNLHKDPRKFAAKIMAELKDMGDTQEVEEDFPEPDIRGKGEDGKEVTTYSTAAFKKALDVYGKRLMAQIFGDKRIQSVLNLDERQQILEREAEVRTVAASETRAAMAEISKAAHYDEVKEEVATRLAAMKTTREGLATLNRVGPVAAMWMHYADVVKDKVLPGYDSRAEERVRADFAKKAAATGDIHPSHASDVGGNSRRPKGVAALAKHMEKLAEATS